MTLGKSHLRNVAPVGCDIWRLAPLPILGQLGDEPQVCPKCWMNQVKLATMECDPGIKRLLGSILFVSYDRTPNGLQLRSNLMFAAGDKVDLELIAQWVLANVTVL